MTTSLNLNSTISVYNDTGWGATSQPSPIVGISSCSFETLFPGFEVYDCVRTEVVLHSIGHPLSVCVSTSSLFFNVLVIFVIRETMKKRKTQAQFHLVVQGRVGQRVLFMERLVNALSTNRPTRQQTYGTMSVLSIRYF